MILLTATGADEMMTIVIMIGMIVIDVVAVATSGAVGAVIHALVNVATDAVTVISDKVCKRGGLVVAPKYSMCRPFSGLYAVAF